MNIVDIITSVGIPMASFLIAVAGIKYVYDQERKRYDEVTSKIMALIEAINENTKTLTVLVEEVKDLEEGRNE